MKLHILFEDINNKEALYFQLLVPMFRFDLSSNNHPAARHLNDLLNLSYQYKLISTLFSAVNYGNMNALDEVTDIIKKRIDDGFISFTITPDYLHNGSPLYNFIIKPISINHSGFHDEDEFGHQHGFDEVHITSDGYKIENHGMTIKYELVEDCLKYFQKLLAEVKTNLHLTLEQFMANYKNREHLR